MSSNLTEVKMYDNPFQYLLEDTPRREYRPKLSQDRKLVYIYDRQDQLDKHPNTFTEQDKIACLEYFKHSCALCGAKNKLCFDHWIPVVSEDFPGTIAMNMIPLCISCNSAKNNRQPAKYVADHFGYTKLSEILDYFIWLSYRG